MQHPNTDTTYCIKECKEKCWRHESNFKFNDNKIYWFTNECIEAEVKEQKWKN